MRKGMFVLVTLLMIVLTSCGKINTIYKVINNSSYEVKMTDIKNATVSEIGSIPAGTTTTITFQISVLEQTPISFSYSPANYVKADLDTSGEKITFANR
jgi:hypothetical protein